MLRKEEYAITFLNPWMWRVSGFGDVAGMDKSVDPKRKEYIIKSIAELFNPEASLAQVNFHSCIRPTPPDDVPILGSLRNYPNVFLNTGHSGRGTTMSLGTSKIVAEMILKGEDNLDGKVMGIDITPYSPRRFNL